MNRIALLLALAFAVCTTSCGLGNGDQARPAVIASSPIDGASIDTLLSVIRIDYDSPVVILQDRAIRVQADGTNITSEAFRVPGFPNSIFVHPVDGSIYPPAASYRVTVSPSLAVNFDLHYMLENYVFDFDLDADPPNVVASGDTVYVLDGEDYTLAPGPNGVTTPGNADTLGLITRASPTTLHTFVQTTSGMAYFETSVDAGMTPIALTTGGALDADARTAVSDIIGKFLYVAYRDSATMGIRLYRIDMEARAEDTFIDIASIVTGLDTMPTGVDIDDGELFLCGTDGTDNTVAVVDLETFTEVDLDPVTGGVQGKILEGPAGPVIAVPRWVVVGDPTSGDVERVSRETLNSTLFVSSRTGATMDMWAPGRGDTIFQPLTGFSMDPLRPVQRRRRQQNNFGTDGADTMSDLIGDTSAGTMDVTAFGTTPLPQTYIAILDGQILLQLFWTGSQLNQFDFDELEDGIQALDLAVSAGISGVDAAGTLIGSGFPGAP